MDNKTLEKILIGLGVGTVTIAGLLVYLQGTDQTKIWQGCNQNTNPMQCYELFKAYNAKLNYIYENCDMDKRCVKVNGIPSVKYIKDNVSIINAQLNQLDEWLKTEDSVFVK